MKSDNKISLLQKVFVCLITGLLGVETVNMVSDRHLPKWIPASFIGASAILFFFSMIVYIFIWQTREKKQIGDSENILAFLQGIIISCISFVLLRLALLQIVSINWNQSLQYSEAPVSNLSGANLMNLFFGRVPNYKLIIASLQIVGSISLLFRRTRLLGIFILLPILLNITLMYFFFHAADGFTVAAIIISIGLLYVLSFDIKLLIAFFFKAKSKLPTFNFTNGYAKNVIRIAIILLPLLNMMIARNNKKKVSIINKKPETEFPITHSNK